jgi:hypothetical protein
MPDRLSRIIRLQSKPILPTAAAAHSFLAKFILETHSKYAVHQNRAGIPRMCATSTGWQKVKNHTHYTFCRLTGLAAHDDTTRRVSQRNAAVAAPVNRLSPISRLLFDTGIRLTFKDQG